MDDNYTPFQDVYDVFLSNISDYELAELEEYDLNIDLMMLLRKALPKCTSIKNVTLDLDAEVFNRELDGMEINIIADYMCVEWIKPKIYNIELLKQRLNAKDYSIYSQANHLKELREIQSSILSDALYWDNRLDFKNYSEEVLDNE